MEPLDWEPKQGPGEPAHEFRERRRRMQEARREHKFDDGMPTLPEGDKRKPYQGIMRPPVTVDYDPLAKSFSDDPKMSLGEQGKLASIAATVDAVNLPSHYARFKIEPIRFLVENFGAVILVGKVVKYVMRYDAKNGLEDIAKARRCLDMLEQFVRGNPDWWQRAAKRGP